MPPYSAASSFPGIAGIGGEPADQFRQMRLKTGKALMLLQRVLVHVEAAMDFQLKAVQAALRIGIAPHQFDPLVGIVELHPVAQAFQKPGDVAGKIGVAGRAVAVAQDEIGAGRGSRPKVGMEWQFR